MGGPTELAIERRVDFAFPAFAPVRRSAAVVASRALRNAAALSCALLFAACGKVPELVGVDNAEIPAATVAGARLHQVFILSTLQSSEVIGAFYSEKRAPDLGLASVQVSVPPSHRRGELERPRKLPPDPRTEFAVVAPRVYATDAAFVAALDRELQARPPGQREILLFIHGFNNTASDAILRIGQFVEDTGFRGVPVLVTWASAGRAARYVYDLNSALVARGQVGEITDILNRTRAERYDVFAHSMGAFLTMEALVQLANRGTLNRLGRIDNIVLASPDIDLDLFRTQLAQTGLNEIAGFYVLLSRDDRALHVSRMVAGGVARVGIADAETLASLGVTAIDLSEVENSRSGSHSKFAGSPEVVQFIGRGLNSSGGFGGERSFLLTELLDAVPIRIVFE